MVVEIIQLGNPPVKKKGRKQRHIPFARKRAMKQKRECPRGEKKKRERKTKKREERVERRKRLKKGRFCKEGKAKGMTHW